MDLMLVRLSVWIGSVGVMRCGSSSRRWHEAVAGGPLPHAPIRPQAARSGAPARALTAAPHGSRWTWGRGSSEASLKQFALTVSHILFSHSGPMLRAPAALRRHLPE